MHVIVIMPLLRECDMCGKVDRSFAPDKKICLACENVVSNANAKAFERMQVKFEAHISAQVSVLSLLEYLLNERRDRFQRCFGTQGIELLERALGDVEPTASA